MYIWSSALCEQGLWSRKKELILKERGGCAGSRGSPDLGNRARTRSFRITQPENVFSFYLWYQRVYYRGFVCTCVYAYTQVDKHVQAQSWYLVSSLIVLYFIEIQTIDATYFLRWGMGWAVPKLCEYMAWDEPKAFSSLFQLSLDPGPEASSLHTI